MRVLLVGAGGVGTAVTRIAARRPFFDHMVVADYDLARAEAAVAALGADARFTRRPGRRRRRGRRPGLLSRAPVRRAAQRHRPALRDAAVRGGARGRGRLPRHGDVPVPPASRSGRTSSAASSWATSSSRRPTRGRRPGGWPWSAWAWSPACPTCSPATPPTSSSTRSRRSASATARTSPSTATTSRRRSPSGPPSRSASTRRVIYEKDRGWFTTEPFSEPEVFDFPEGIGPVECVNVEHEEVLLVPALGRRPPGHLQVRPRRRSSSTRSRRCTCSAWTAPSRSPCRTADGPARSRRATWSPRCLPDPADARRPDARQDLRRHLGEGHQGRRRRARCTSTTWSTTSGRCASTAPRPWSGRPPSTRSSPSNCSPPAPGRAAASSAPRPSRPRPFLDLLTEYGSPWGMREQ